MFDFLCGMVDKFPKIKINGQYAKVLRLIKPEVDAHRYCGMGICLALILGFVCWGLVGQLDAMFAGFVFALVFLLSLPNMELEKKKREIEMYLPFFLRNFGMLIDMKIPFYQALELAAEGNQTLTKEIRITLNCTRNGRSMQNALAELAISFNSMTIKRAVSQLISVYETGGSGREIRKFGDELMALEQHRLKEYAAKSSIFGLLFVMLSAVLPTFFIVYIITGRIGLGNYINQMQMTIILLIILPSVSALVLMISKMFMPRSVFSNNNWFDIKLLFPAVLLIVGSIWIEFRLLFFGVGTVIGIYFIFDNYKHERKIEDIEEKLPDALFAIGGMPKSIRVERLFETVEQNEFGALSQEMGKAKKQLSMNIKVGIVLDDLAKRNKSKMLEQTCMMMKQMIETNSLDQMSCLADDMIRNLQIKRDRSQLLSMQKYTMLLGAVLVPTILKTTLNLIQTMGEVMDKSMINELVINCNLLIPPYLVIYAIMVAIAIADSEGKKSAMGGYSIALTVLGLVSFYFINL
ncbi:Type II secretion system (T2SS), protein F [Candidatus Bilamarchaeum dharawalense]|uniref:Type II secretion system (T2SS), protein F n=1 Tax=Candidatus Bilamarchaeum dharawalense TaxID=2885759 RepID=A0A5E4LTB5_9ARCH|nr:Type II secretion system (T2SS), protein F [Candidatus Bilamarchaeum dharawalense]